jgi:hypothetical protein
LWEGECGHAERDKRGGCVDARLLPVVHSFAANGFRRSCW